MECPLYPAPRMRTFAPSGRTVAEPTIPLMKSRRRIAALKAQSLCGLCFGIDAITAGICDRRNGVPGQVARQQFRAADIRFVPAADIPRGSTDVRFTPQIGH